MPRGALPRRQFLAAAAALSYVRHAWGTTPAGVPDTGSLKFQVSRNGRQIGTHNLTFSRLGHALTVRIEATFRVHFGPLTLYRYHHQGTEQWRDGNFVSLDTETNDDGNRFSVSARRSLSGVVIQASGLPEVTAPAGTLPLTHWALSAMGGRLFNPEDGKLLAESAQALGPGVVSLADGRMIQATRFALSGEAPISDWFDASRVWAALDATGKDGSAITYRRL